MNIKILFILIACICLLCSDGARILGVFPLAGRSLNILYNKLFVILANAGHDVTVISAHKPKETIKNGSLRHIDLTGFSDTYMAEIMEKIDPWNIKEHSRILGSVDSIDLIAELWSNAFKIPEVHRLIHSNEIFDAVIMDDIYMSCFRILGQIFNCPVILFQSYGGNNIFTNAAMGNPLPPSYVPHFYMNGPNYGGMNFFGRLENFVLHVVDTFIKYLYVFPEYNRILRDNFDNPPDISTFYNNISLLLVGSYSSVRLQTPQLPNVVEIGGFHIDPPKKLPKDLQKFLDEATDGAIYFSLGTHIVSKYVPPKVKQLYINVFKKLKQKVLWKFEEDLPDKSDNVLIRKWLPQTNILAHPNVKLFISHGGHGSLLETIYHGVPCLMIPLFFDQYNNVYQAIELGIATKINYDTNEETFLKAVKELLENPKYSEKAKMQQRLFHDRPMKPVDAAIFWVEYVIRNKGAHHLKLLSLNMPWYQFYSLDVIFFLLVVVCAGLYLFYFALKASIYFGRKIVKKQKVQ